MAWYSGGTESYATDINGSGQVVGYAQTSGGQFHAFIWQGGALTDLGVLPGTNRSFAQGINSMGQVVGWSDLDGNNPRAFIWQQGVMTDLGPGLAQDINDSSQVVGYDNQGFLWQNGSRTALSFLAFGININGQIVGGDGLGRLWQNGVVTNIGPLSGDTQSWAESINDVGQIVGGSFNPGNDRAYLWQNGTITNISGLAVGAFAEDINNNGQVVGRGPGARAFLWQNGVLTDLGQGDGSWARAINNSGIIVGSSPVLSTPKPSTFLSLIVGLYMLSLFVKFRKNCDVLRRTLRLGPAGPRSSRQVDKQGPALFAGSVQGDERKAGGLVRDRLHQVASIREGGTDWFALAGGGNAMER